MSKLKIFHVADLHLAAGSDEEYGFSVLEEIIAHANEQQTKYLILAGDIFDTFSDAEKLRGRFSQAIDKYQGETIFIPGNHEELRRPSNKKLSGFDFGRCRAVHALPFEMIKGEGVEFIAIPHQRVIGGFHEWQLPPRTPGTARIAIAHGLVPELVAYCGPECEEQGALIDPGIFVHCEADYAALGHIHRRQALSVNGVRLAYPGEARVCGAGNEDVRGGFLIECVDGGVTSEKLIELKSAGRFRRLTLTLSPAGELPELDGLFAEWDSNDYVNLQLSGVTESEPKLATELKRWEQRLSKEVRKLTIDRDEIIVVEDLAAYPLVSQFLTRWKESEPATGDVSERQVWLTARKLALESMLS